MLPFFCISGVVFTIPLALLQALDHQQAPDLVLTLSPLLQELLEQDDKTGAPSKEQAEQIEQSLVLEAASGPDQKQRKKAAREDMASAISRLKSSRLADGRSGRDALSVLPWYLVLGAPGSGKSAAITSSGLPFPGRGGTTDAVCSDGRDCCWWFSNQAVLLEADGRLKTLLGV